MILDFLIPLFGFGIREYIKYTIAAWNKDKDFILFIQK